MFLESVVNPRTHLAQSASTIRRQTKRNLHNDGFIVAVVTVFKNVVKAPPDHFYNIVPEQTEKSTDITKKGKLRDKN